MGVGVESGGTINNTSTSIIHKLQSIYLYTYSIHVLNALKLNLK